MVFHIRSFCSNFASRYFLAILPIVNYRVSSMETKETEQGRQYKEYTREATGNKAERSAQLLGGEFWYE